MTASLFQLKISHGYFASGMLEGWTLAPDPSTRTIIDRYGLAPSMRDGLFSLTTFVSDPAAQLQFLSDQLEGAPLSFWLGCDQEQFLTVTDLPLDWAGQLVLSTKSCVRDGDAWRLTPALGPHTVLRDGVAGVLSVYLDDLLAMGGQDVVFTADFAARPVHWVYYLVNRGQTRLENPVIGKNGFVFAGPQPAVLPGGEKAICFDSGDTAFPLQQKPTIMFDLLARPGGISMDEGGDAEYCVVKGLPVPGGKQLEVRNSGDTPYIFCAMHVYL